MNTLTSVAPYALIVDDNFLIRMEAMEILEQAGFQVLDVGHSDAALELLEARHAEISLLFTDVQMPGKLDGF
ncbi:MAG: response regulator, partial [Janthinobacterium lividum]